jgi:hypothetical protein
MNTVEPRQPLLPSPYPGPVGKKRMRLYSCDGHVEGLEDVRRLGPVHRALTAP